jgi:glucose/arabinose dehydrogenase
MRGSKLSFFGRVGFAKKLFLLIFGVLFFTISHTPAFAQGIDWPTLGFTQAFTNTFTEPIGITHAGDGSGRLFIVQQPGQVLIAQSGSVLSPPFLNISNRVLSTGQEQGLLGLAFPSNFSTGHHFYVDYTRKTDGAIVVSRFFISSTNANVAATNSEQIVLVIPKPTPSTTYNNHNAGQLAFGPDGYLYIGVGDGGSEGDPLNYGQATTNMFGKILRIDVESGVSPYAIPSSNPFVSSNNYVHEAWAYGLRNPWRFSFDDQTGDLYIGDVGQNNYEEIDFQPAGSPGGQNYGWRIMEAYSNYDVPSGFTNFASLTLPVTAYSHASIPADFSAAVIGGYVYRGPNIPRMNGMYFYGDFAAGWVWGLMRTGTNWQNQALVAPSQVTNLTISTFGEDDSGQLYLANYYGGKIYQIQDTLQTWTPSFSAPGGIINSNTVIVTCLTTNAEIHYTTNGINPTVSDPIIASGDSILVTSGFTNKVWAFRSDLAPSGVATAVFTLKAGTPVFSPAAGPITNGTTISISTVTSVAVIYYTLDGSIPSTTSPVYTAPLVINGGTTIKAMAVATNYQNSSLQSTFFQLVQTATPIFNPASGPVIYGTNISISCATPGSTIYYTLDGTTPTTNSAAYSVPLAIYGDTSLNAFATTPGNLNSAVQSQFYTLVTAAAPVLNPPIGPVTNGTIVSISCATPRSIIYYTVDGSTPTTNSPIYSGSFPINGGVTVQAFAVANFYGNSGIVSETYLYKSMENTVVFTVANGLSSPEGICIDSSSDLYVSEEGSNAIVEISPSGQKTNIATISGPQGICIDSADNLYVGDNASQIWKISSNGTKGVLVKISGIYSADQIKIGPDNNIYAGYYCCVQKVTLNGTASLFAGPAASGHAGWGTYPGVGVNAVTNVFAVSESYVWQITPNGTTTLYAGGNYGYADGPDLSALFESLHDATVDSVTNVYVSDANAIRKIGFSGYVSTMAGSAVPGYQNGSGANAEFNDPIGLCMDTNGNIFVADSGNNCIREISPDTYGIGIADWWQLKYFGHVGINPNSDPNNNGLTAYDDFWAGLNPTNPGSIFKIEKASMNSSGTQVSWDSVLGKNYTVQWSSDLVTWNNLGSPIPGNGSVASTTDTTPGGQNHQRFYRVLVDF